MMASLRQLICDADVNTLRQYMCVETGGGGIASIVGDVIVPDGIFIDPEPSIMLYTISDNVKITEESEMDSVIAEEDDIIIEIIEGDVIDVIY